MQDFADKLADEHKFEVWLDRWILVPGEPFIQEMSKGLKMAKTCAVFIGKETPRGWFDEEIKKALNIQAGNKDFRVIPVLLPESDESFVTDFLELRTWVDFRKGLDDKRKFHELSCGIKGVKPGRRFISSNQDIERSALESKLRELDEVSHLVEMSVKSEIQKMILVEHLIKGKNE